jgi:hypothetical protein
MNESYCQGRTLVIVTVITSKRHCTETQDVMQVTPKTFGIIQQMVSCQFHVLAALLCPEEKVAKEYL